LEIVRVLDCPEAKEEPDPEPVNVETTTLLDCPDAKAVPVADPD
jgi:hypothetical protein